MIFGEPFEVAFDEPASVIKYKTYSINTIMAGVPRVSYTSDVLLKAIAKKTYLMSARVGVPAPGYFADAIIVLDPTDPRLSDSFVNCLMWAFANEWRKAARSIELLSLRMKLDYASTDDLDDYWGIILGLGRRSGEDNDTYRMRLATIIRTITSSGTKSNCQAVIDRITGSPGGSRLESFGGAEVVLSWTSPGAIEAAIPQSSLITEAMDAMLAAGISWSTSYPLVDYSVDLLKTYTDISSYSIDGAISKKRGTTYYISSGVWGVEIIDYNLDVLVYSTGIKSYLSDVNLLGTGTTIYRIQATLQYLVGYWRIISYKAGAYSSKDMKRSYMMAGELA